MCVVPTLLFLICHRNKMGLFFQLGFCSEDNMKHSTDELWRTSNMSKKSTCIWATKIWGLLLLNNFTKIISKVNINSKWTKALLWTIGPFKTYSNSKVNFFFSSFFSFFIHALYLCTFTYKNLVIHSKSKYVSNNFRTDHLKHCTLLSWNKNLEKPLQLTSKNERNQLKKCRWHQLDHWNYYGKQKKNFNFLSLLSVQFYFTLSFSLPWSVKSERNFMKSLYFILITNIHMGIRIVMQLIKTKTTILSVPRIRGKLIIIPEID